MKKISFIIPIYNCENYIEKTVKDIVQIGLDNYEILLIDDGSKDSSGEICDRLANENEHIICIHQSNGGASAARNKGIESASGEFIVFLDADDSIDSLKMKKVLADIETDDDMDMLIYGMSFDYFYRGKCYRSDELYYPQSGIMKSKQWIENFEKLYLKNCISSVCNKVFRRDIITKHLLRFSEEMIIYEDLEFVIRYMAFCEEIYNSSEVIYHYIQAEDEGNAGRRLQRIPNLSMIVDAIEKALDSLIALHQAEKYSNCIKSILLQLYLVIAREKIEVSDMNGVRQICDDFSMWTSTKNFMDTVNNDSFAKNLLEKKIYRIMIRRVYGDIRHRVAVKLKNSKFY